MFQRKIKKDFDRLVRQVEIKNDIPEYRIEEIKELAENNEIVLAFEVLNESIFEFMPILDRKIYDEIVSLAIKKEFNLPQDRYAFLEKMVAY